VRRRTVVTVIKGAPGVRRTNSNTSNRLPPKSCTSTGVDHRVGRSGSLCTRVRHRANSRQEADTEGWYDRGVV
jgi:hypothetical protein